MGGPMARRIHGAGFPITVYDIAETALEPFRALGVPIVSSPVEVANNAEIVIACLPAPEVSIEVALGEGGITKGSAIEVYIESSTLGPDYMGEIAEGLAPTRITCLDAPISGGIPGATSGTLSVVSAGDPVAIARVRPIIGAYASHIFHVADKPGPAQIAKLINNMLSTSGTIAAFEGMVVGAKAGLDVEQLLAFINVSTGRNVATMQKIPNNIFTRKFGGKIQTGLKDVGLFLKQCEHLGIEPFIAPRVQEVLLQAIAKGYDKETMRLIEFMEERAGGVIVKGRSKP
jgi:3-hydroxyisobutyrate dehydrogenase-like beta-hydroxyacid dehydrogenase